MKYKIAPSYSKEFLEVDRPAPLVDNFIESLIQESVSGNIDRNISNSIFDIFKERMTEHLKGSKLNKLYGLDSFDRIDICSGCTQYIDSLYMKGNIQTLEGDYRYHTRLTPDIQYSSIGNLRKNIPLIIAMPFPSKGAVHSDMIALLDEAYEKNVTVHIDGAWITCCKDIVFNFDHPAIESVAISLSKGLGLGWNRVALRWTKNLNADSISIMNDFNMNIKAPVLIALHFLKKLTPDYLWNTHGERYNKVCKDFDLTPTQSIYLALNKGQPVGVSPLIRFLENAE